MAKNNKPCRCCGANINLIDERITEKGAYIYEERCFKCDNLKYAEIKKAPGFFWGRLPFHQ